MSASRNFLSLACFIALSAILNLATVDHVFAGESGGVVAPENTRLRNIPNYSYVGGAHLTLRSNAYFSSSFEKQMITSLQFPAEPVHGVPEPPGLAIVSITGGWLMLQRRFRRNTVA
jgi:hypothetical protein